MKPKVSRFKQKRLQLGLSQNEAARLLGVSVFTVARWDQDKEKRGLYKTKYHWFLNLTKEEITAAPSH